MTARRTVAVWARKRRSDYDWLIRTGAALASGLGQYAAFAPRNQWWLAVIAIGFLAYALRPQVTTALSTTHNTQKPATARTSSLAWRTGAWLGFVAGLGFYVPLLPWIGVYVGPAPWIALAVIMAAYGALGGALVVAAHWLPWRVYPVWFAACWVAIETLRSSFPFGGFPWGRLAFTQTTGPLRAAAAAFGVPGVSFVVALTGAGLAVLVILGLQWRREHSVRAVAIAVLITIVGPVVAAACWPSVSAHNTAERTIRVAAIQGNVPRLGLDFNAQRRAVLDNHIAETHRLAEAIKAGQVPRPDVVIWPENSSDIDPTISEDANIEITNAAHEIGVPILVGTLVYNDDGRPTNTVLVWQPPPPGYDSTTNPTALISDRYSKHILQPFGEYLPWRSVFEALSSYAKDAGNFEPGTGPESVAAAGIRIGLATCWEIAFDRAGQAAVKSGGQLLAVPTNNATFGRTEMTYQQLAMSQLRAIELGRAVVVPATTGVSAIIRPDGSLQSRTQFFTSAFLEADVPLHTDHTWAVTLGPWPSRLVYGLVTIIALWAVARRIGNARSATVERRVNDDQTTVSG